jgi:hypothetical protein
MIFYLMGFEYGSGLWYIQAVSFLSTLKNAKSAISKLFGRLWKAQSSPIDLATTQDNTKQVPATQSSILTIDPPLVAMPELPTEAKPEPQTTAELNLEISEATETKKIVERTAKKSTEPKADLDFFWMRR